MENDGLDSRLEGVSDELQQGIVRMFKNDLDNAEENYQNALKNRTSRFYKEDVAFRQKALHHSKMKYQLAKQGDMDGLSDYIDRAHEDMERYFESWNARAGQANMTRPSGIVGYIRNLFR